MEVVRKKVAKRAGRRVDPQSALRILRMVSMPESFLFFTGIGQYTGEFAPCLTDFCEKLNEESLKSVEFHFDRGDFEKWIRETIGDEYLAYRISKIDRSTKGEDLRRTIERMVKRRVESLKAATI